MILLLLSCAPDVPEFSNAASPTAVYPLEGDEVTSQFLFQGNIPSKSDGSFAIIVWGEDGIEQEYSLHEVTEEFSYKSEVAYEPGIEYCWTAWFYPEDSVGARFTPQCFYVVP
jgi:hypothetical protein